MARDSDITSRTPRRYPFSRNRLDPDPQYAELRRIEPVCRVLITLSATWPASTAHSRGLSRPMVAARLRCASPSTDLVR